MKVLCGLALVCVVLLEIAGVAGNGIICAKIIFKHLQENYVEVAEHSTTSIKFEVRNDNCSHLQDEQIKLNINSLPQCRFRNLTKSESTFCQCKDYVCSVNKTASREDNGTWTFSSVGKIKQETLDVNVTYPPNVTSFRLTYEVELTTEENQSIQATCRWENGNPRKWILIRNPRDQVVAEKWPTHVNDTTLLENIFRLNTSCSDSGLYRCEAENTDEYRTALLQIKCPPQFNESDDTADTVIPGQDVTRHYNLFSFKNITNCTLKGPARHAQPQDCMSNKSEVSVTGTPPQLHLTLVIRNAREEDNGTWQLSVKNGFTGKASIPNVATVNFTLDVIPVTTEPAETTSEDSTSVTETSSDATTGPPKGAGIEMWQILMIISIVVAAAALGLCIFITARVYRSRKKSTGKNISSPNGQTFGSREPLAADNSKEDCGMIVNELYSSSEPRGESIMITNDIYEGSGDTRTSTAPVPASGYEEVKIDAGNGTVAMVSTKTTGNNAGVYANTAQADAQRKKEGEKEKNKKRPKERAPGPPASGMGEAKKNKKESNKKEKEASPSKSKAQTNTADAKTTNTAEKPEKGRNSGKKEAKPNSTEKTASTGNPTNDENKKAIADAPKIKPDAAKTKSDPAKTKNDAAKTKSDPAKTKPDAAKTKSDTAKTKPDASKSKPDQAKHDASGAKADAPDTNANARTKTDATEGAASNDDQGSIFVDARVPNAEGCLYGQLDFSRVKPRTTVIKDLPSTDYAEINFKASPPPPPAP